jgi:hypothetical protein
MNNGLFSRSARSMCLSRPVANTGARWCRQPLRTRELYGRGILADTLRASAASTRLFRQTAIRRDTDGDAGRYQPAISVTWRRINGANRSTTESNTGLAHTTLGGRLLTGDRSKSIAVRIARRAVLFWEAREALRLIMTVACTAAMIRHGATDRPTVTIPELSMLMWMITTLLKQGRPPLL